MSQEAPDRDELAEEIELLRSQVRDHEDRMLRALADLDNHRKRSAREKDDAYRFALQNFVGKLLPVKDSLERALAVDPARDDQDAEGLREGIRLTLRMWEDVLADSGVEEIDPIGRPFDPDFHEALSLVHDPEVAPNTVAQVVQKGYVLNGRLIRPARVIVAAAEPG